MSSIDCSEEPTTRESFIAFLRNFHEDYLANKDAWENNTLESFLQALAAYAEDVQSYYNNTDQKVNADVASWKVFSDILRGARVYE